MTIALANRDTRKVAAKLIELIERGKIKARTESIDDKARRDKLISELKTVLRGSK